MIYTDMTKMALRLCYDAHAGQTDKNGMPYVFHPYHLAEQMTDELSVVCALLHDVVEDTDYSFDDIRNMGFPDAVIEVLKLLTHDDDVPYMEYISAISADPTARTVKLADLRHNSDLTRLDKVDEKALKRAEKYKAAYELLMSAGR